jgi:hypothetical protein
LIIIQHAAEKTLPRASRQWRRLTDQLLHTYICKYQLIIRHKEIFKGERFFSVDRSTLEHGGLLQALQPSAGSANRVTRLGEFQPIWMKVRWKSQKYPTYLGYFFPWLRLCINFDKKWVVLHFGRYFHKLFSPPCMQIMFWAQWSQCVRCWDCRIIGCAITSL